MSSIFPGRNATKEQRNVDDTRNEETMNSTCQKVKKEDKTNSPMITSLLYFALKIALQKLPHNKLTVQ